jgi:glycerol-3-phosphate acyltransferase PlsY
MDLLIVISYSYLSGSIPFGLILAKVITGKDIRKIGSGNIGATNVFRTGSKILSILTLILDALKGFFPVVITQKFFPEYFQISCLIVFLGHIFPLWLKFKGGKGVATYLGVLFALSYELSILFIFTWIVVLLIFKFSSVSSIFSSLTVFIVTFFRESIGKTIIQDFDITSNLKILLFIFFILIVFTHQKNIYNLKNKTEKKINI